MKMLLKCTEKSKNIWVNSNLFIYLFICFIMQVKLALRAYGQQVPKTVKTHIHACIQKSNKLQIIN